MLRIDRMRISLPVALEHRARRISRLLAEEMASGSYSQGMSGDYERFAVGPVVIDPRQSDRQVARSIAAGIRDQLTRAGGRDAK